MQKSKRSQVWQVLAKNDFIYNRVIEPPSTECWKSDIHLPVETNKPSTKLSCSALQMLVFRVLPHPQYTHVNFVQCIDKDAYNSNTTRLVYLFSSLFFMYLLPLLVIIFCYTGIVVSLARRSAPRRTDSGQ